MVCITLFLTGCITSHKLSTKTYPAKPENCKIDILTKKPDRAFEKIVLLKTKKKNNYKLQLDMKKKACRAGGDAIIMTSKKVKDTTAMYLNPLSNTSVIAPTPSIDEESIPILLQSDIINIQATVIKYMK